MSVVQEKFIYSLPEERQYENKKASQRFSKRAIRRGKALVICCVIALFVTGVTIAYYYSQIAELGYEISKLQKELSKLQAEQEYLETQANQLMSLQRIEAIATTKLGMVKPDTGEVVLVAALPKNPEETAPKAANLEEPQAATTKAVGERDNGDKIEKGKSPVIEAFFDLVRDIKK
ncbi:cell division protein FtsL [Desulfotomaculum sp. 1211_IL3151]|uniref:cell division protein FtsL n=1 Tax=Desulfotomaculum sp. 1211_IL3151 TaxID=3084055 RepID=UPI002FD9D653